MMEIKTKLLYTILFLLAALIGGILGNVGYEHDVNKCTNLKSPNYEFTHDVQIDAHYESDCFYTLNHPLARVYEVSFGVLIAMWLMFVVWFVKFMIDGY